MNICEYEALLKSCDNLKQLDVTLKNFLKSRKITSYAFTYFKRAPSLEDNEIKHDVFSDSYKVWHKYYLAQGYNDIDSTLNTSCQQTLPVFWDVKTQLSKAKTPREKLMRQESIAFGVEQGISIPIHGPNGDFAELVVSQRKGEDCLSDWQNLK
ncbi:MAG: autoinducer binding domain-containing protein, partial [Gammaproteobacteria bacterium]|nr:autoinducer binding domain-containing protein [Gammaproteobacteria bacterium]